MEGSLTTFDIIAAAIILLTLPLLIRSTYRLYLHPLANVPGPKLAALTSLHELWYDCFQGGGGQHAFKMREMHDTYGKFMLFLVRSVIREAELIGDRTDHSYQPLGSTYRWPGRPSVLACSVFSIEQAGQGWLVL